MAKAKPDPEQELLDRLKDLLATGSLPLQATKGGLFPNGAKGKPLVERATEEGLIETFDHTPPKTGKKAVKSVVMARLTEAGFRRIKEKLNPQSLVESLIAQVSNTPAPAAATVNPFDELADKVTSLAAEVEKLSQSIANLKSAQAATAPPLDLREEVADALQRLKSEMTEEWDKLTMPAALADAARPTPKDDPSLFGSATPARGGENRLHGLTQPIVDFLVTYRRDRGADCPLPDLFDHLRGLVDGLTIGEFHDLIRKLYAGDRIRLTLWAAPLDRIPRPEYALFIKNMVMYYAWVSTND